MAKRKAHAWSKAKRRSVKKYNAYKRLYTKRKELLERRGFEMADTKGMLTYTEWKTAFASKKHDLSYEVETGERASIGDVNSALVSDQAYEFSQKQAYALLDYLKLHHEGEYDTSNINTLILKIRQGKYFEELGTWDDVREYRKELFSQGYSKEQVKNAVSHLFFGSP